MVREPYRSMILRSYIAKDSENGQANALSRRPDYKIQGKTIEPAILRKTEDGSIIYNHHILATTMEVIEDPIITKLMEAN